MCTLLLSPSDHVQIFHTNWIRTSTDEGYPARLSPYVLQLERKYNWISECAKTQVLYAENYNRAESPGKDLCFRQKSLKGPSNWNQSPHLESCDPSALKRRVSISIQPTSSTHTSHKRLKPTTSDTPSLYVRPDEGTSSTEKPSLLPLCSILPQTTTKSRKVASSSNYSSKTPVVLLKRSARDIPYINFAQPAIRRQLKTRIHTMDDPLFFRPQSHAFQHMPHVYAPSRTHAPYYLLQSP